MRGWSSTSLSLIETSIVAEASPPQDSTKSGTPRRARRVHTIGPRPRVYRGVRGRRRVCIVCGDSNPLGRGIRDARGRWECRSVLHAQYLAGSCRRSRWVFRPCKDPRQRAEEYLDRRVMGASCQGRRALWLESPCRDSGQVWRNPYRAFV